MAEHTPKKIVIHAGNLNSAIFRLKQKSNVHSISFLDKDKHPNSSSITKENRNVVQKQFNSRLLVAIPVAENITVKNISFPTSFKKE